MIGILLITHGALGQVLLDTATHVLGRKPERVGVIGMAPGDDRAARASEARGVISQIDDGNGVLVLTDIYGASPSNVACQILNPGHVEGLTGVSLPMLVKAISYRNDTLEAVLAKSREGAATGIIQITKDVCYGGS
jgi:mannose PTS system EIIA component